MSESDYRPLPVTGPPPYYGPPPTTPVHPGPPLAGGPFYYGPPPVRPEYGYGPPRPPATPEKNGFARIAITAAVLGAVTSLLGLPGLIYGSLTADDFTIRSLATGAALTALFSFTFVAVAITNAVAGRRAARDRLATNGGLAVGALSLAWVVFAYTLAKGIGTYIVIRFLASDAAPEFFGSLLNFLFAVPN